MDIEKFCGRKNTLDLLRRRVLDLQEGYRQNVALLGYPYLGKTAILQKFLAEIDEQRVVTVTLDLENQDFCYFYYKLTASLLYRYAKLKGLPLNEDLPLLVEAVREHLPQTIKAVKRIQLYISQNKRTDAYREIISLPQIFAQETNMFCVLVLDEFQELENLSVPDVFKILGAKIITQKRCLYVIASSVPAAAEAILSEKMSLLFGNFEKITVEPLDHKTSREFIARQLEGLRISDSLCNFLVDFSGGQPLIMQLVCEQMVQLAVVHRQEEVFLPLLTQALANVLFHNWGVVSRHYDLLLHQLNPAKTNFPLSSVMLALIDGRKKIKDLAAECGIKQTAVNQKMARLVELGVVLKNGGYFYLKDKVFRFWLKYVFRRRQRVIDFDQQQQLQNFQTDVKASYESFILAEQKDFSARIVDLLACFDEDALQINGRRYELPLFRKITAEPLSEPAVKSFELIRAATAAGEWLVVLNRGTVAESDINQIVSEVRRSGQKPQRCILIAFNDLDESARVRALQERMWIWNENELRTLLNLFDKPFILPV